MAITFVGSKTFSHAATTNQTCSLTDLLDSSGATATLAEDDVVFVNYSAAIDNNRTDAQMLSPGYTNATPGADLYQVDNYVNNQLVFYKMMGASPDTTISILATNSTSRAVGVTITALRGVDVTTPIDDFTTAGGTNTGVPNAPSITPVTSGTWILAFGAASQSSLTLLTNPAGMGTVTNHFKTAIHSTATRKGQAAVAIYTDWTSGAFDPAVFGGGDPATAFSWNAVTLAVKPASGGGGRRRIVIS